VSVLRLKSNDILKVTTLGTADMLCHIWFKCHFWCSVKYNFFFNVFYAHRLRWSRGSVLAFSTQVCGFKPGRSRRIFKGEKILSTPSFGGEVKPLVPCHRFLACKRSLNGVEVVISAKLADNILAHSSHFRCMGSLTLWRTWRHLVVKSGNI